MLFKSINSFVAPTNGRVLSRLTGYINTLNTKRSLISDRYTPMVGMETNCVRLIRKILADADAWTLVDAGSDLEIYRDTLGYALDDLENIFDSNSTGNIYSNMFIRRTSRTCEELIVPVSCDDPFTMLPMNKGWDAWKDVRPVRLVDINSNELTFNTYTDQIVFKRDMPSMAIITIDVMALVLQFVNYLRYTAANDRLLMPIYIHRYVLVNIIEDLENLWLRNRYISLIKAYNKGVSRLDVDEIVADPMYGFAGTQLTQALAEIYTYIKSCDVGNITPSVLLSSLRTSTESVATYLMNLLNATEVSNTRQYMWAEYLRDVKWLDLIQLIYDLNPSYVMSRNLRNALGRDIPLSLINNRIWMSCRSQNVREFIRNDIEQRVANL